MEKVLILIPIVLVLLILGGTFFIVKQQTAVIIERFGKFNSVRNAGFQIKIPFVDKVAAKLSLRVTQLDVNVETKTKDDVFVKVKVSVQYHVLKQKVYDAYYELDNPHSQITSYVFDVVRAEVPKMKLDDVFEKKDDIALAIRRELQEAMKNYGYGIVKALVTDIDPDEEVKIAMNRINAAEREKLAATYEAEAVKIKIIAKADAEAESKKLQGEGIANQRREIAKGLEDSVGHLNQAGINPQEASALIVITQHYDTLQAIGEATKSNLILLPNSPGSAKNLYDEMVTALHTTRMLEEAKDEE